MPSLLDDPEAYAFAAQLAEDERKKLGLQSLLGGIGGLLEAPVSYVKERATALATDPIGDMKRTMQGTIDRAKQREQLQQIAYGDPQNPTRVTDQAAADQLAQDYLDMASTIMPAGMTVFHGSPYKFNAFDPTKIGSGEGAQAYGYGHYVAESPDVAKSYAVDASSNNAARTFAPRSNAIQNSIDYFEAMLKNEVSRDLKNGVAVSDDYIKSQIAQLNDQLPSVYKIDLPDDQIAKMLDWDAEISKQSKEVQDLAKQYGLNMDDLGGDLVAAMDAKRPAGAESMRQAGVPGIKYFDAQSRGGQKADTRNFVVFPKNEGLLKIEEVNGQPVQGGLLRGDAFDVSKADASDIFGAGAQKTTYKDPDSGGYIQVLTRPDQPASVTALEVPEAFRQQGIGGRLQEQALKDFPNMQGQVSSKSAARSAYKQGRRPVGQPDATLDDVLKMIDEDSSVNLVSPARQQEMSGSQGGLLDTDYRGSHSAPNAEVYGATLDDLTKIMPANVYAPEGKQLYGLGDRLVDSEWRIAALKTRGKPDAEIEVYRAVPKGVKDINSGDWVTTSKTYADQHGERTLDGDYEIIKRKVKARTLSSEGYPYEFGYNE
jgi:predicted GNAT family acetyltransferase